MWRGCCCASLCQAAQRKEQLRPRPCLCRAWRQAFADRSGKKVATEKAPFKSSVDNFYQTDVISRTSVVMAKCVQARNSMRHGSLYGSAAPS